MLEYNMPVEWHLGLVWGKYDYSAVPTLEVIGLSINKR